MVLMGVMPAVCWERTGVSVCVFMRLTHNPAFVIQHNFTQIKDQLCHFFFHTSWTVDLENRWLISDLTCCVQTASLLTQRMAKQTRPVDEESETTGKGGAATKDEGRWERKWRKEEIKESVNVPTCPREEERENGKRQKSRFSGMKRSEEVSQPQDRPAGCSINPYPSMLADGTCPQTKRWFLSF